MPHLWGEMKYLGSYHELTSRQVPGVGPKVEGHSGVELTKWLPLCWTPSAEVRVWLQALPRLSPDLVVIEPPWAGQKGVLLPSNYCLGEGRGTEETNPQNWRQGIRVSADELADAAGSVAVSWQGNTATALSEPSVTVVLGCQQPEQEEREERWGREAPACWATFNYFGSHQRENCPPWQISPAQRACTQSRVATRTYVCRAPFIQKKSLHNSKHHHS